MYKTDMVTYTSNPALGKLRQNCCEFQGQPELQKMKILPLGKNERMWTGEKTQWKTACLSSVGGQELHAQQHKGTTH